MDLESKDIINQLIKKNINRFIVNYNKSVKRRILKPIQKINKVLSIDERIHLSWNYIQNLINIPQKNDYIQRFIQRFSREPFENEDQNFLYHKESRKVLLCKHYIYSSKVHNDEDSFITLKRLFGGTPNDGIVSCQCCGEYICHEDYSILEGFSDGAPKNTKEVLEVDKNTLQELSDKQVLIKKRIHKISSLLSIDLNDYDKNTIIHYFDLIDHDDIIDYRYKNTNTFKKHPSYKDIKKKYKFVKPAKSQIDKNNNKKNKDLLDKELINFRNYLIDGNELLIITFLILFHLQVSLPPYEITGKMLLNLWDKEGLIKNKWSQISNSLHTKLSMKTINYVFSILNKYSNVTMNARDTFWSNVNVFFNEGDKYKNLIKIKAQFLQICSYVLRNSKLRDNMKNYYNSQNDIKLSVHLRERWSSYRPLNDTKIINSINEQINKQFKESDLFDHLIKKGVNIAHENISTIQPINQAYNIPKHKSLKIPYSEIMKNESYKRLLEYSIHLHGISNEIPYLNNLIHQFINTIEDNLKIEEIMESIGWNKNNKSLKNIDFLKLRKVLMDEIQKIFKENNPDEKNTIDQYNYIKINNWNGMLLTSHPKRIYSYKNPNVFPNKNYLELKKIYDQLIQKEKETKKEDTESINIIKSLFNRFCFDDDGNVTKRVSHDEFILNIVADPSFEREINCQGKIEINEENFHKILNYNIESNRLVLYTEDTIDENLFEKRMHRFIQSNDIFTIDYEGTNRYELIQRLNNLYLNINNNPVFIKKDYRETFNQIEDYKKSAIENIKSFFIKSAEESILSPEQLKLYKQNRGSIENIGTFLTNYLNDSNNIENNIYQILSIVGRLSNDRVHKIGTILSDHIPKHWKLSDVNVVHLQEFINEKEFLLHNDIFLDSKKYKGFYKYLKEEKYSVCFKGLFNAIQNNNNHIYNLSGDNYSYFTETYSKMFKGFYFIIFLENMIEYVESLYDDRSLSSQKANELFLLLEERDEIELRDSIHYCTQLIFDLLIHTLDEYSDPNWIFQTQNISDKLSRQKEIEKQNIINDLEGKTTEQRQVTIELQKQGNINWYKDSSLANLDRQKTEEYEEQFQSERIARNKEELLQNQTEMEVAEMFGIHTDNLFSQPIQEENDQGYSQKDGDQENEKEDDPDQDGDYREN